MVVHDNTLQNKQAGNRLTIRARKRQPGISKVASVSQCLGLGCIWGIWTDRPRVLELSVRGRGEGCLGARGMNPPTYHLVVSYPQRLIWAVLMQCT